MSKITPPAPLSAWPSTLARTRPPPLRDRMRLKVRKVTRPRSRKYQFLRALPGTGGVLKIIAENMGISPTTVAKLLERPDWQDVRAEYVREVGTLADDSVAAIRHAINQRIDLPQATLNARWYLSKVKREQFGEESTVKVEGGKLPVQVDHRHLHGYVDLDALNLPVEVKRQIVEAEDLRQEAERAKEVTQ